MDRQSPETKKRSYRGLKICCIATTILLITIAVVLVILYFTVFKPKEPTIITRSVTLKEFKAAWPTFFLNLTLGLGLTIDNENYGGFKYEDSIAYVYYRGEAIGEAPISADTIPARKKHDMDTSVTIFANKLFGDDNFQKDFLTGIVNFTSSSTLQGKVIVFNLFKKKATSFATCYISIYILPQQVDSVCKSTISF